MGRPWLRRLGVAVLVVAALTVAPPDASPAPACDWDQEFLAALRVRGEDPPDWTITPDADGPGAAWVDLETRTATVSRVVPCRHVRGVVTHEWLHLLQSRVYGAAAAVAEYRVHPDEMELVADCGALLLGSGYTPYVRRRGGCGAAELAEAVRLIAAVLVPAEGSKEPQVASPGAKLLQLDSNQQPFD